ncbi:daptide biosynthesis RiPP recognition protein [Arthrobacter sp. 18067]|uniref:daptide biosynthesis RiPP recognition protein n=1 Tax=Arthrobacter sp. 18067 TaxID=2681413 RepID=UPI001F35D253|nr:daptide biosynthesis RiPP recognition protein [Arthrobacter sp. 18067]
MGVGSLKLSQQQSIAAAVDQWVTGIPGRVPGHVVFVENPEHTDYAKSLAGEDSAILVLNGDHGDPDIVPVSGTYDVAGEELLVDGTLALEIQDYVAIPFVNLVGVTVVRIATADDWQAFFDDADEALRSGHFVRQLTEVNAVLAERALLSGTRRDNLLLARLHIRWDGSVMSGPYGTKIGRVGDSLADLRVRAIALRPESAVAGVYYPWDIQDSLAAKPWIPRYLAALEACKFIPRDERGTTKIVGFGVSLYGSALHDGPPSPNVPFILTKGSEHTVLDTSTGRLFKVGPDAAAIIEAVSNLKDIKVVARVVAPAIKVSAGAAEGAVRAVVTHFEQLGIDILGAR